MTVLATNLSADGWVGSEEFGGKRTYTTVYQVEVDDKDDGPSVVLAAAGLPILGSTYTAGNDFDTLTHLLTLGPAERKSGTRLLWLVPGKWGTPPTNETVEGVDKDGNPTKDPLDFRDRISMGKAQFSAPVERAVNWTALSGRPIGTTGAVINSALVPFNPPLEMDQSRSVIRIIKTASTFPDDDFRLYRDAVNADSILWRWTEGVGSPHTRLEYSPLQLKMASIGGSLQYADGVTYWEIEYEMHVNTDTGGWRDFIADRGIHRKAEVDDPDGFGGTISSLEAAGNPAVRRIIDANGIAVSEPVLLNGFGQPLQPGEATVYLQYQKYLEVPFGPLNLDS